MPKARPRRLEFAIVIAAASVMSCSGPSSRAAAPHEPYVRPTLDWIKPVVLSRAAKSMDPAAIMSMVSDVRGKSAQLTPAGLARLYPAGPYVNKLSYAPQSAQYLDAVRKALRIEKLQPAQRDLLDKNGFAVLGDRQMSYGALYDAAYHAHAPIVITTDSLLYAFHQSYENILKELETAVAIVVLDKLLTSAKQQLSALDVPAQMKVAADDVAAYLGTAHALLAGDDGPFTKYVVAEAPATVRIIGKEPHPIDFSLFKPRGHYAKSEELSRYFRAMQWLQQIPFRYIQDDGRLDRRAFSATLLLAQVRDAQTVNEQWKTIDGLLTILVGPQDDFSLAAWSTHFAAHRDDLNAYVSTSDAALLGEAKQIQFRPRIVSGLVKGELPTVANTKQVFLMGARYAADSEVLSQVSYDRLEHPETKTATRRMKPSEMDVQFALGSNVALDRLDADINAYQYQGRLRELRFSLDHLGQTFWSSSVYNGWVDALRSLSLPPTNPEQLPEPLRTRAWDLKMLNTKLASWAELRHDNILYVKQSFSAIPICDYPEAYLEPYPDFYERMSLLHTKLAAVVALADWPNKAKAQKFVSRGRDIYAALAQIAHKEVQHKPLHKTERVFLKRIIDAQYVEESAGCTTIRKRVTWDGWYTELFYRDPKDAFEFERIIADVHTTPADKSGKMIGWVLHAATSTPHPMVLTIDDHKGNVRAYVGPVSRFHRVETLKFKRLTDQDWERTSTPAAAAWQKQFLR